jgi:hypothetical protein
MVTEMCKTSRFHYTRLHIHLHTPANTVGECDSRRHCGASEAAQQSAQQRAEILKSLGETSSLSDGLRNFMRPAPDKHLSIDLNKILAESVRHTPAGW